LSAFCAAACDRSHGVVVIGVCLFVCDVSGLTASVGGRSDVLGEGAKAGAESFREIIIFSNIMMRYTAV